MSLLFGELLHQATTDFELGSDQGGIHLVINNSPTNPGDIVLVKLHFTWWLVVEVMPTKSLADTAVQKHDHMSANTSVWREGLVHDATLTLVEQRTFDRLYTNKRATTG